MLTIAITRTRSLQKIVINSKNSISLEKVEEIVYTQALNTQGK